MNYANVRLRTTNLEGHCINLIKSVKDGYNFLILKEVE
jgi:hypothetical protein